MKTPNTALLSALSTMRGNQDFELVMLWIKESRKHLIEVLPLKTGEDTVKLQGELLVLNEIIKTTEEAADILFRIKQGNT